MDVADSNLLASFQASDDNPLRGLSIHPTSTTDRDQPDPVTSQEFGNLATEIVSDEQKCPSPHGTGGLPAPPADSPPGDSPTRDSPTTPLSPTRDYSHVCAIDFGMTSSTYAFYARQGGEIDSDRSAIIPCTDWGLSDQKTPSIVLTKRGPHGDFVAFGSDAVSRHANMGRQQRKEYSLFRNPKAALVPAQGNKLHYGTMVKAEDGSERRAHDVIAMLLRGLKTHFFDYLQNQLDAGDMRSLEESIRWVVTVPANWSDAAKQFMRDAAREAGLWREGRASQLILSIESEAASVWCLDQVIKSGQKKFLLVDVGGGTTDISAHEVLAGRGLRQLCESRGISYGGDNVNKVYAKLLATILGDDVMGDFKSKHAADYLDHMRSFEEQKRIFRPSQIDGISLSLQNSLLTVYEEHTGKKFKQAFTDYEPDIIDYEDNRIHIKTEGVTKMFSRVIQKILKHIEVMQTETEGIDKVLLVGGFSGCPMLQRAVRETFQGQGRVVVPDHPGLCVVKGAVQYGFRSDVITSRVAKRTYGFLQCKRYDPDLHDEKRARLLDIDDTLCCSNLVKRIVTKGENVAQDFEVSVRCRPVQRDQRGIELILLSFNDPDVKYCILEEEPELHAKIVVPVKAGGQVQVRCLFGGTEIRLLARDADGLSDWHETTVGFLCY